MKGLKSVSRLKRFNKSALCVAVLVISSGLPIAAQTACWCGRTKPEKLRSTIAASVWRSAN